MASLVIASGLLFSGATAASAHEVATSATALPMSLCSGGATVYQVHGDTYKFTVAYFTTGGPNITLTIARSTEYSITGSVQATGGITASIDVLQVSGQISQQVAVSFSNSGSVSGAWTVPSTYKLGELAVGTNVHSGTVVKYLQNSSCALVQQASSAYRLPVKAWSFKHYQLA